jgi:hypothetical protein
MAGADLFARESIMIFTLSRRNRRKRRLAGNHVRRLLGDHQHGCVEMG